MTLGPICPLCGDPVRDDEEGRQVWFDPVGSGPERNKVVKKLDDAPLQYVLGMALPEVGAAIEAVKGHPRIELDTTSPVEAVRAVGSAGVSGYIDAARPAAMDTRTADQSGGATVTVLPDDPPDPDRVMHEWCFGSVFGGENR